MINGECNTRHYNQIHFRTFGFSREKRRDDAANKTFPPKIERKRTRTHAHMHTQNLSAACASHSLFTSNCIENLKLARDQD